MQLRNILIVTGLIVTLIQVSCKKFLDQEPKTALTQEQAFSKLANIQPLISGLYSSWRDGRKDRYGFMFELGSDEAQQGAYQVFTNPDQAGLDKYDGYLVPRNNALAGQWSSRWPIVTAAAQAVFALQNNKEDEATRTELLGEASFIRAAVSFELTQFWGKIPISDQARFAELGTKRQPLDQVYAFIINDLETAAKYLPETQADKKHVTKYAALALLGKVYMSAPADAKVQSFQKAADTLNLIIQSGKYSLLPNYADLWDPNHANSPESIYEYQFGNTSPDNNVAQWQMGSRAAANLPTIGANCYFGGYDLMVPTSYCYSDKSNGGVWETGDVRKLQSIRYDFTYHGIQPTLGTGFGGDELNPHVKKYEDIRTDSVMSFYYSGKDIFYLRYADVLLCYAECLNELQKTSDAVSLVNSTVRIRAFGGTLPDSLKWDPSMSADDFRTRMLDERMRELCFEGWRRMDLLRSGKFVDLVKARNQWTKQSGTIQSFNQLYPIPLTETLQNPDIPATDQNPGY
jgi:starch-binding outer membrane protein, SusD/RagB family